MYSKKSYLCKVFFTFLYSFFLFNKSDIICFHLLELIIWIVNEKWRMCYLLQLLLMHQWCSTCVIQMIWWIAFFSTKRFHQNLQSSVWGVLEQMVKKGICAKHILLPITMANKPMKSDDTSWGLGRMSIAYRIFSVKSPIEYFLWNRP